MCVCMYVLYMYVCMWCVCVCVMYCICMWCVCVHTIHIWSSTQHQDFSSNTPPPHPNLIWMIKALLAFGATVNCLNQSDQTPLDIAHSADPDSELVGILTALGGLNGEGASFYLFNLPQLVIMAQPADNATDGGTATCVPEGRQEDVRGMRRVTVGGGFSRLKYYHRQPDDSLVQGTSFSRGEGYAAWKRFRKNKKRPLKPNIDSATPTVSFTSANAPLVFQIKEGERILCLDGGSMRGLIQIEILSYIEEVTGCRITELFDWIVGTSTGGVVALGLVYGKSIF